MNKIELVNTGGFPFETDDLEFMRDSYELFNEFSFAIAGSNPVILKGCEVAGSSVADGIVIINGEILPFVGGTLGTHVAIVETVGNKTFEDGVSRPVYKTRVAQFAVSGTEWSAFTRMNSIASYLVPPGAIMMWSGTIGAIPAGWKLCDGTNGTPNLKGKFIVGYDSVDADYDAIGKTGGAKNVTLTADQSGLRAHKHQYMRPTSFNPKDGSGVSAATSESLTDTTEVPAEDALEAHENRPPYYVLAYIMKA